MPICQKKPIFTREKELLFHIKSNIKFENGGDFKCSIKNMDSVKIHVRCYIILKIQNAEKNVR